MITFLSTQLSGNVFIFTLTMNSEYQFTCSADISWDSVFMFSVETIGYFFSLFEVIVSLLSDCLFIFHFYQFGSDMLDVFFVLSRLNL